MGKIVFALVFGLLATGVLSSTSADCGSNSVTKKASGAKKAKYSQETYAYCPSKPGLEGNGHHSTWTATIKNGVCQDCVSNDDFRPGAAGLKFCDFAQVGESVVANAFTTKKSCPLSTMKSSLQSACVHQKSDLPFYVDLIYKVQYCGETKTVVASGGGKYNPKPEINPVSKWTYAVKP